MAGSIIDLAKYRFEKAKGSLRIAESLLNEGEYSVSLNRSYYAVFHAVRAVNALDGFDSSKHSGVIGHFNREHVKTGDFDKDTSKVIRHAMDLREQADYEDFYLASRQDAEEILEKTKEFLLKVEEFLKDKGVFD